MDKFEARAQLLNIPILYGNFQFVFNLDEWVRPYYLGIEESTPLSQFQALDNLAYERYYSSMPTTQ